MEKPAMASPALAPDAARLTDSYRLCKALHRKYGRSYYLATRPLPAWKRPHVHALYGFARYADEIVDDLGSDLIDDLDERGIDERGRRLRDWSDRFLAGLHGEGVDDPLLPAVLHTVRTFELDLADFVSFLDSMRMDLTVTRYPDYPALLRYMEGSAAAIGTMMVPILGAADPVAAREPARQLGFAFQLTNFIRDVAEDLTRGRIYLPMRDLAQFGVTEQHLAQSARDRHSPQQVRALVAYQIERARRHYVAAEPGIELLDGSSRACVRSAHLIYAQILDEIERAGHEVFGGRATVPASRRLRLLARALMGSDG